MDGYKAIGAGAASADLLEANRVLRQQLLDAQRALAWLLWQQPYREATITSQTMRDMPPNVTLVSECDPRTSALRLWVQKLSAVKHD